MIGAGALYAILVQPVVSADDVPTVDEWRVDLDWLAERIEQQHPNAFATMHRSDFEAAISKLRNDIPNLQPHEIAVRMMQLAALVGDGHTRMHLPQPHLDHGPSKSLGFHRLPVTFYQFSDGLFIRAVDEAHKELAGSKVLRIGHVAADEAMQAVAALVHTTTTVRKGNISLEKAIEPLDTTDPPRNTSRILDWGPWYLSIPEILHALTLVDSIEQIPLELEHRDGSQQTIALTPIRLGEEIEWIDVATPKGGADPLRQPLYLRHPEKNFWFEYLADERVVYAKYNRVLSRKGNSIYSFRNELFEFIDNNPVDKLVIDVRNNGGGNNNLNRTLLREIIIRNEELNHRGKLFCIIGRQTFSAAMNFVNSLERWTNAIFVGEPTAGAPNHFGDAETIRLPNSRLTGSVSTRYWQDSKPRESRPWIRPDIPVQLSSEDFRDNHDPVLQAILDWEK